MSAVARMVAWRSALFAGIAPDLAMASGHARPEAIDVAGTLPDRAGPANLQSHRRADHP